MKSNLIDLTLNFHGESANAIRVSDNDGPSIWLPKSQIEFLVGDPGPGCVTVTMPGWLAMEKGLI